MFEEELLVIVSESLTFIPYTETEYPNYEYPPSELKNNPEDVRLFRERLESFRKITPPDIKCYYIGGKIHKEMLESAGWNIEYFKPIHGLRGYREASQKLRKAIEESGLVSGKAYILKFEDNGSDSERIRVNLHKRKVMRLVDEI